MPNNTCPICLGSLATGGVIGVSVACGHPFHQECYDKWTSICTSRDKQVKCPTCNVASKGFTTIYINLADSSNDAQTADENDKYYESRYYKTVEKCEDAENELKKLQESNKGLLTSYENAMITINRQARIIEKCDNEKEEMKSSLNEQLKTNSVRMARYERDLKSAKEGSMAEFNEIKSQHASMRSRIKKLESDNRRLIQLLQDQSQHYQQNNSKRAITANTKNPAPSNRERIRNIRQVHDEFQRKEVAKKSPPKGTDDKPSLDSMKVSNHAAAAFKAAMKKKRKVESSSHKNSNQSEPVNIATSYLVRAPSAKRQGSRGGALSKRWNYDNNSKS